MIADELTEIFQFPTALATTMLSKVHKAEGLGCLGSH